MEQATKDYELERVEENKKAYMEAYKRQNNDSINQMTKNAQKKHEKVCLTNWQQSNSVLG